MLYIPTTWWNAFIQSIDTSAVTNVAVTPAAKPCNVIAGRKYIGGSDSECAISLVLTLIFARRRGGKEICRRCLNLRCVADRIQILHTNGNIKVILQWIYDSRKILILLPSIGICFANCIAMRITCKVSGYIDALANDTDWYRFSL